MAEQIVNEFTVNRPIDEAWPIICDVERIAPCLPGAELEEIARLIELGASVAWEEEFAVGWPYRNVVLRDPEGNEFCLGNEPRR